MLRSFLLITFRILWRNKVTSFVNVFSLGVGITAFIFIMLYVQHEVAYDKFHENYDRIYRLEGDSYGELPPIFGYRIKDKLPEVENVAFLSMMWTGLVTYIPENDPKGRIDFHVKYGMSDSTTFDVFTFPMIKGDPKTALRLPMSIVLTESMSRKIFGDEDPVGKTVISYNESYHVTGVIEDMRSSHVEFDILISASSFPRLYPERNINNTGANSWAWSATYLLMNENVNPAVVEEKINKALSEINNGIFVDTQFKGFHIRPLKDLYFNGDMDILNYGRHGNIQTIAILITIGIFLLALSGINYVNLTTARSTTRSKEIAVKRVTGSSATMIRIQLIGESVIISFISLAIALTVVQLLLNWFRELTGVNIDPAVLTSTSVWLTILGGGLLIGVLAGIYPAFFLTAIQPLHLMKGEAVKSSRSFFRSMLMTFQFTLSVVMIVAIIVIYRQLSYVQTADLGFNKQQIITVTTPTDFPNEFNLRREFKSRLQNLSGVEGVAFSYGNLGTELGISPTMELNGELITFQGMLCDEEYLNVMGMTIVEGQGFSPRVLADIITANSSDKGRPGLGKIFGGRSGVLLLNETARNELGAAVGQRVYQPNAFDTIPTQDRGHWEILGVVKDFHFQSFHEKIQPMTFMLIIEPGMIANIKVSSADFPSTIKAIEKEFDVVWNKMEPFNYEFVDETFDRQYKKDQQLAIVIGYFSMLAIVIACLGLFALSSFMVSSRIKEIGVRKALGASVRRIYAMLSWDFLKWILVAIVIACPVAWFTMNAWLDTFAYHVSIGPDVFVMAAALAIAVALLTITGQSLKVAKANPVDSLRYE